MPDLDALIKRSIQNYSVECDIRKATMTAIRDYEINKHSGKKRLTSLIYIYTLISSIFSFFFIEYIVQTQKSFFISYGLHYLTIKYLFQGLSVTITILLIGAIVFQRLWHRKMSVE